MANYQFTQTGDEIQAILDKAQTPDSTPTSGSSGLVTSGGVKNALDQKVDKVSGKGLSTNDYTNAEKSKLAGIASGAQANVIEGVQVNGTDLPVSGKKVNVSVPAPIDNLTSTSTTSPLSANQGKVLDGKVSELGQTSGPAQLQVLVEAINKLAAQVDALKAGLDVRGDLQAQSISSRDYPRVCDAPMVLYAAGVPAAATVPVNWDLELLGEWTGIPCFIGQVYVNTASGGKIYMANNNSAVSNWIALN